MDTYSHVGISTDESLVPRRPWQSKQSPLDGRVRFLFGLPMSYPPPHTLLYKLSTSGIKFINFDRELAVICLYENLTHNLRCRHIIAIQMQLSQHDITCHDDRYFITSIPTIDMPTFTTIHCLANHTHCSMGSSYTDYTWILGNVGDHVDYCYHWFPLNIHHHRHYPLRPRHMVCPGLIGYMSLSRRITTDKDHPLLRCQSTSIIRLVQFGLTLSNCHYGKSYSLRVSQCGLLSPLLSIAEYLQRWFLVHVTALTFLPMNGPGNTNALRPHFSTFQSPLALLQLRVRGRHGLELIGMQHSLVQVICICCNCSTAIAFHLLFATLIINGNSNNDIVPVPYTFSSF